MEPMEIGIGIPDCRYMGMGLQIREWEYNNGNRNELLFAHIACDVLAQLQYALGLAADAAAVTLTQETDAVIV